MNTAKKSIRLAAPGIVAFWFMLLTSSCLRLFSVKPTTGPDGKPAASICAEVGAASAVPSSKPAAVASAVPSAAPAVPHVE